MPDLRSQSKVGENNNGDVDESSMDEQAVESMGDPGQGWCQTGSCGFETQIGIADLRKCMNEEYVGMTATFVRINKEWDGMNKANKGMHEL